MPTTRASHIPAAVVAVILGVLWFSRPTNILDSEQVTATAPTVLTTTTTLPPTTTTTAAPPTTTTEAPRPVRIKAATAPVIMTPPPSDYSVWDALAQCESGGNWQSRGTYYGGLQFLPSTWRSVGGQGLPSDATREEQIMRGKILQARSGWGQWPACSRRLGLR